MWDCFLQWLFIIKRVGEQSIARVYYSSQNSNTVRVLITKEMGMAKIDAWKER